jgi:hypothetical protein
MKSNRRKFLQNIGTSAAVISLPNISNAAVKAENSDNAKPKTNQAFNMSGFSAPKVGATRARLLCFLPWPHVIPWVPRAAEPEAYAMSNL